MLQEAWLPYGLHNKTSILGSSRDGGFLVRAAEVEE
ncbi:hypothetical protein PM3016_1015 [Paenibacillus mucilaginosus 3016]|uniref:Uncharacterized protein n=1 Tax=Paenibacillus mucilaginosus 3016 TaxID=1116391 RepID=H6N9E8_9BACL|nr:hypothetical protein PM3016_1015 [Paenibacillus mucilaginosus 3016]